MDPLSKSEMYLASREALIRLLNDEAHAYKGRLEVVSGVVSDQEHTIGELYDKSYAKDAKLHKQREEIDRLKGTLVYAAEASAKAAKTIVKLDVALQKLRHTYPKGFNGYL